MVCCCVYYYYLHDDGLLLLVDSESILKMMKMLLKKFDIVADTAENGRIAVDMIMGAAEPYQLVLMDNLMPEMVIQTSFNNSITSGVAYSVLLSVMYDIFLLLGRRGSY